MAKQSTIISEERIKLDELEMYLYGTSSTQIYLNYREVVNKRIKMAMLDLANYLEKHKKHDPESLNKILVKKYMEFYAKAEPSLQKFYEELQDSLKPPDNVCLLHKRIIAKEAFCSSNVSTLEKEIDDLEEKYMIGKYYLEALKKNESIINTKCLPIKEKMKCRNIDTKYAKLNSQANQVLEAKLTKYMDGVTKEDIMKLINSDIELIFADN